MNTVALTGNMTRDPDLRATPGGKSVAQFAVAISDGTRDREHTSYIDCTAFDQPAEYVARYGSKGARIEVEGRLYQETWTDKTTGGNRCKLTVRVHRLHLPRQASAETPPPESQAARLFTPPTSPRAEQPPAEPDTDSDGAMDDIPF